MAARPLPEASHHTADFTSHPSPDVDPEAIESYGPSEKETPNTLQIFQGTAHLPRGRRVILVLLLLCCLAFVASAFTRNTFHDRFFTHAVCVPERHAPLADHISAAFRSKLNIGRVYAIQESVVDILEQKYNTSSRVGCHAANVRDYMRQTYPVVESSLQWADVSRSAVVLHWQGADRKLRPVAVLNRPELYGPEEDPRFPSNYARDSYCEEEVDEHRVDLADVQSAVGMLTAVEALVQNGYQPSRTLVLTLMLCDAADLPKVSEYLHSTYDEHGLNMGFKFPPRGCKVKILDFFHRLYWRITDLFPIPAAPPCFEIHIDDNNQPPLWLRYLIGPEVGDKPASWKVYPAKGVNMWMRMIIAAGQ